MTTTRKSNFSAGLRTVILMAALGGLLVVIGAPSAAQRGAPPSLVISLLINFLIYWFSDKIALASAARSRSPSGGAAALPDGPRALTLGPTADAPPDVIPTTSRTRSRPAATRSTRPWR